MNSNSQSVAPPNGWRILTAEKLAIRGARLLDPATGLDQKTDLLLSKGVIDKVGVIPDGFDGEVITAEGWIVCPGLFDMHVHLREPGYEYKETVKSGCWAAMAGGFTGIAPMPNTNPPVDNPGIVNLVRNRAEGLPVSVHPVAAISQGRQGVLLAELAELSEIGVTAFSDDGSPVSSAELMRLALEYTRMLNVVVIEHCEESSLTANGVMDEGAISAALGLSGWPSVAEDIAVDRNIRLAEYTGGRLHIAHVSTAGSVEIIRAAKERGVNVTAEVTPHHLTLDSSLVESFDSCYKVNPPLRTRIDSEALIHGLADGVIDVIATDHAPHAEYEKEVEFNSAPFGMIGLETALAVVLTRLVSTGKLKMKRMIEVMSTNPLSIMGLPPVKIQVGAKADLTLFDPEEKWKVDRNKMLSKSKNSPFDGWELQGRPRGIVKGQAAYLRED